MCLLFIKKDHSILKKSRMIFFLLINVNAQHTCSFEEMCLLIETVSLLTDMTDVAVVYSYF